MFALLAVSGTGLVAPNLEDIVGNDDSFAHEAARAAEANRADSKQSAQVALRRAHDKQTSAAVVSTVESLKELVGGTPHAGAHVSKHDQKFEHPKVQPSKHDHEHAVRPASSTRPAAASNFRALAKAFPRALRLAKEQAAAGMADAGKAAAGAFDLNAAWASASKIPATHAGKTAVAASVADLDSAMGGSKKRPAAQWAKSAKYPARPKNAQPTGPRMPTAEEEAEHVKVLKGKFQAKSGNTVPAKPCHWGDLFC